MHRQIKVNQQARSYESGVADCITWKNAIQMFDEGVGVLKISQTLKISRGLASKIGKRRRTGKPFPIATGKYIPKKIFFFYSLYYLNLNFKPIGRKKGFTKWSPAELQILNDVATNGLHPSIASVKRSFEEVTGTKVDVTNKTLCKYLKIMDFKKNGGEFVHPNKFNNEEKKQYYQDFLAFQALGTFNDQWHFCFQDESHIEKNDQGYVSIWNAGTPTRHKYKASDRVEKWTITGVTMLAQDFPLYFSIIQNYSNGVQYHSFMINEVLPRLNSGDVVFVDNQNYHVTGKYANDIIQKYNNRGIQYKRLPVYSPELNPIELVWGYMKVNYKL
jgi:hypothetical protein